jgi:hypothetical protein
MWVTSISGLFSLETSSRVAIEMLVPGYKIPTAILKVALLTVRQWRASYYETS